MYIKAGGFCLKCSIIMCRMYIAVCLVAFFACCYAAPNKYIINGDTVDIEDFPYQVSVQWGNLGTYYHICGGAVIGTKHVLTAKHCCGYKSKYMFVVANENNVDITSEGNKNVYKVQKRFEIPADKGETYKPTQDDLCVLEVDKDFPADNKINLSTDEELKPSPYTLTGWGYDDTSKPEMSKDLKKVDGLEILPRKSEAKSVFADPTCEDTLDELGFDVDLLYKNVICTANRNEKTVCNGDSGGPLVDYDSTDPTQSKLVGIVSWGIAPCGHPVPNFYTHVVPYTQNIGKATTGQLPPISDD